MKKILILCLSLLSTSLFAQRIIDTEVGDFNKIKVFDLIEVNLIQSDENKIMIKGRNVDDGALALARRPGHGAGRDRIAHRPPPAGRRAAPGQGATWPDRVATSACGVRSAP